MRMKNTLRASSPSKSIKSYRKLSIVLVQEVSAETPKGEMNIGVIRLSTSPFSSIVVIVKKKMARFDSVSITEIWMDARPGRLRYPRTDDTLRSLSGTKYLTTLYLKIWY